MLLVILQNFFSAACKVKFNVLTISRKVTLLFIDIFTVIGVCTRECKLKSYLFPLAFPSARVARDVGLHRDVMDSEM